MGVVPQATFAGGLGLQLEWPRVAIAARAELTGRPRLRVGEVAVDVRTLVVGADLMVRRAFASIWEVSPYLGAGSLLYYAAGVGFERNRKPTQAVFHARAGARLRVNVNRLFFGVRAGAMVGPAVAFRAASGLRLASAGPWGAEFGALAGFVFSSRTPRG